MTITTTSTFIPLAPSLVRTTLLDFPTLTTWDKSYMTSITPLSPLSPLKPSPSQPLIPHPTKTTGDDLEPGDRIHATFWGGEVFLEVLENSKEILIWKGTWHGLVALRSFEFVGVEEGGVKGTRFVQSEEAGGFMGLVLLVDGWMGGSLRRKFEKFGENLGGECGRRFMEVGK